LKGNAVKDYDKGELTLSGVEVIAGTALSNSFFVGAVIVSLFRVGRQNLFSLDGAKWQHMKLIIDPAFRPNLIRLLCRTVLTVCQQTVSKWKLASQQTPQTVDNLFESISTMTLDVICQVRLHLFFCRQSTLITIFLTGSMLTRLHLV
jgi:cytochrome P450